MPTASACLIINATAGSGYDETWAKALQDKLCQDGLESIVVLAKNGEEILRAAHDAVGKKYPIIAAGGGDGTINAVASAVVGHEEVTFGVLPMGTLNHFAKDLNIPLQLPDALATIVAGHTIKVDVGTVNDRIFLNNSSLGLYPHIVRDREMQQRLFGRAKWLAFFWATLATLRRYPFLHIVLGIEGEKYDRHTPFVFIGNNPYQMEGFSIGKRERFDTGKLSLYTAQRTGRLGLLALALRALVGRLRQAREFDERLTEEILVETPHGTLRVATDGEVNSMATPLRYRIRPGALRVLVPREA